MEPNDGELAVSEQPNDVGPSVPIRRLTGKLPANTVLSKQADDSIHQVDEQGFQPMTSKATKKAVRKAASLQSTKKKLYLTKSKVSSPTKLALKKLLIKFKPDVCFISEPWMHISNLSPRWLHNLGLKVFCVNDRNTLLPNLWCLCSTQLSPTLLNVDDQQISIQLDVSGKLFGITGVYASNCYVKR